MVNSERIGGFMASASEVRGTNPSTATSAGMGRAPIGKSVLLAMVQWKRHACVRLTAGASAG